jgi:SulP family sulfate permease
MSRSSKKHPGLFSNVKGDLFGGITAGIVALPLALAFGVQSGLGAASGLYGAIFIGLLASFFGGTPTQISGPTAPMTAVSMVFIASVVQVYEGDFSAALPVILGVFAMAGIFQILMGWIGVGKYIKYIPYPVVSGFMSGIGVIIIITQLLPLFGYYPAEDHALVNSFMPEAEEVILDKILKEEASEDLLVLEDFKETIARAEKITEDEVVREAKILTEKDASGVLGSLKYLGTGIQKLSWIELLIALGTIVLIYLFKSIKTKFPGSLFALLFVTAIVLIFDIPYRNIGSIPEGWPLFHIEVFSQFSFYALQPFIITAITLAALGAIDSLLTSVVADNLTKTKHDSRKELMGQGIGNTVAAMFGGIPGAGATIRTVVNINAGGRTRLSGMLAAFLLLFVLLVLSPYASLIPTAVLVGILVTVGIGVMDYRGLKAIHKMPRADVMIMLIVLVLTVFWNLVYAVAVGLVVAALIFMKKMGDYSSSRSEVFALDDKKWADEQNFPKELLEEVYIKHITGPLFFGYTTEFSQLSLSVPSTASHVILRMERVPFMDQSGTYALEDMVRAYRARGVKVLIAGIQSQPWDLIEASGIVPDLIEAEHIFEKFKDCTAYVQKYVKDEI